MKKFLGIISLAVVALAGCTKTEVEVAAPSSAKTIYASVNTKTVNDGLSTKWAKGDAISVFSAEEGDDTYSENTKFEISDIESGAFTGTAPTLEEGVAYDWFAYYPYTPQIKTPANTNAGFMTIGSAVPASQIQKGDSNKAHLAGKNYPLIGKATSVPAEDDVVFQMEQATAVVAINVTNSASADLQVSSVEFTATEDIVGTYYINIAGDEPIYTGSGEKYVSNTAKLDVVGSSVASGESSKFYIGVKPFSAAAGETLKISVNGYEKTITLSKDVEFARGVIKTVNFNYDEEIITVAEPDGTVPGWYRVEDAAWLADGDKVIIAAYDVTEGTVPTLSVTQNANNRSITAPVSVTVGDDFTTLAPSSESQIFSLEDKDGAFAFKCVNGTEAGKYIYAASSSSNYLKSQSTLSADGEWRISITDGVALTVARGSFTHNVLQYNSGSKLFSAYGSASQDAIALYKHYGEEQAIPCSAPEISCQGNVVSITTSTVGADIYYTVDGTTPTTESTLYTTPFAITANTTVKAIAVKEGLADSQVVTIEAEYVAAGEVMEYSFTILPSAFNSTSYAANNGSHSFTAVCTTDDTKTITVECTTNQVMLQTSVMQWQKNTGYIYNNTNLGTIKSVTVTSTAGTFTTYYGTSPHPTSGETVGNGYFTVSVGDATGKTTSVEVVFEK